MKTNLIATAILLGTALACPAQYTTPPPDQKPPGSFDPFAAQSSEPNAIPAPATGAKAATQEDITFLKTQDGNVLPIVPPQQQRGFTILKTADGRAMVLDANSVDPAAASNAVPGACRISAAPVDESIAGVGVALQAKDGMFMIGGTVPDSTAAGTRDIHPGDRLIAVGEGLDQAPALLAGKKLEEVVAMLRGKAGSVVRLVVSPAGAPESPARTVTLVRTPLAKLLAKERGASLSLFGGGSERRVDARHPGGAWVTRLYSLASLISKDTPASGAPGRKLEADAAFKTKTEAFDGWLRTVLQQSEPEGATLTFSVEAGAYIARATEAQHALIVDAARIFEDNYGK